MILIILILFNIHSEDKTSFTADKYTNKTSENLLILDKNVKIKNKDSSIEADYVEVNTKTDDFKALGNVLYETNSVTVKGTSLLGNLKQGTGFLEEGSVFTKFDTFNGTNIIKKDNYKYEIENGTFTSCKTNPADWSVYGENMDIDFKAYAKIDNALVQAYDFPFLYIPYLVIPLKQERQSGFLVPSFGFNSEGSYLEDDYFWAINRSNDATFTVGNYQNRGIKKAGEYRTVFSKDSYFNSYVFNIYDDYFANTLYKGTALGEKNRTSIKADAVFKIEEDTYFKSQIRYASDDSIPRDFQKEIEGNYEPALENKFFLYKKNKNFLFSASANYYQNLLDNDPLASNSKQIQKLPELSLKMAKYKYSFLMYEADLSYLNLYRPSLSYDDSNNNLTYEDNEKIRTAQKFSAQPRISAPIVTDYFTLVPSLTTKYNYYVVEETNNSNSLSAEAKLNLNTEIYKNYNFTDSSFLKSLKHIFKPYVEYVYVNDILKLDDRLSQFERIEAITATNYVKYGFSNRILASKINSQTPTENTCPSCETKENEIIENQSYTLIQPLTWNMYQYYDIEETKLGNLYSTLWFKYNIYNLILTNYLNIDTNKLATSANASIIFNKYYYTNLIYTIDKTKEKSQVDQVKFGFGASLWSFYSNFKFIYNRLSEGNFLDKVQERYFDISYKPCSSCWFVTAAFTNRYDKPGTDINFLINFIISGEAIGVGNNMATF